MVGYLKIWVFMAVGILIFRVINAPSDIPWQEHMAGIYFAAVALAAHYFMYGRRND